MSVVARIIPMSTMTAVTRILDMSMMAMFPTIAECLASSGSGSYLTFTSEAEKIKTNYYSSILRMFLSMSPRLMLL